MDLRTETTQKKKIPLFDIALLLVLVLAVVSVAYWATHRQGAPVVELTYTVRFSEVDNSYSGSLAVGQTLYTTGGTAMGNIREASVTRSRMQLFDPADPLKVGDTYQYGVSFSTEKSDVTVTVTVKAEKKQGGYFLHGNRIAAGSTVHAMVNGYFGTGTILTVEEHATEE